MPMQNSKNGKRDRKPSMSRERTRMKTRDLFKRKIKLQRNISMQRQARSAEEVIGQQKAEDNRKLASTRRTVQKFTFRCP